MAESQMHYAKSKKSNSRLHTMCSHLVMTFLKRQNYTQKTDQCCHELGLGGGIKYKKAAEGNSGKWWTFLYPECGGYKAVMVSCQNLELYSKRSEFTVSLKIKVKKCSLDFPLDMLSTNKHGSFNEKSTINHISKPHHRKHGQVGSGRGLDTSWTPEHSHSAPPRTGDEALYERRPGRNSLISGKGWPPTSRTE